MIIEHPNIDLKRLNFYYNTDIGNERIEKNFELP